MDRNDRPTWSETRNRVENAGRAVHELGNTPRVLAPLRESTAAGMSLNNLTSAPSPIPDGQDAPWLRRFPRVRGVDSTLWVP